MTNSKKAQAARNAAEMRLRNAHRDELAEYMREEHEKRGIKYTPRLSAEERAARDEALKKARAAEKITALAEAAGLSVSLTDGDADQPAEAVEL